MVTYFTSAAPTGWRRKMEAAVAAAGEVLAVVVCGLARRLSSRVASCATRGWRAVQ